MADHPNVRNGFRVVRLLNEKRHDLAWLATIEEDLTALVVTAGPMADIRVGLDACCEGPTKRQVEGIPIYFEKTKSAACERAIELYDKGEHVLLARWLLFRGEQMECECAKFSRRGFTPPDSIFV